MIGRLQTVVIDSPDPRGLAEFYCELLGKWIVREEGWIVIGDDSDAPEIAFQHAPDLREPRWPDPERPQQFHFDVQVEEIGPAEEKVLALGARRLPGEGDDFRVYADPAGHPFCLVWD